MSGQSTRVMLLMVVTPPLLALPGLEAQVFKVALRVTEKTGGQFESEYAADLRRLADVQVVTTDEKPDFVYSIVVQCIPDDCRNADSYAVAISLDEQLTFNAVSSILQTALELGHVLAPSSDHAVTDSATTLMLFLLRGYQERISFIAGHWGRDAFRSAIAEDVAGFDRKCLEMRRLERRMIQANVARDTVTARALADRVLDKNAGWICQIA